MTDKEFDEKYKPYLEEGHYGLAVTGDVVDYLDKEFEELIQLPGFSFSQIKLKFGMGRFYCEGVSREKVNEIEDNITKICNEKPY